MQDDLKATISKRVAELLEEERNEDMLNVARSGRQLGEDGASERAATLCGQRRMKSLTKVVLRALLQRKHVFLEFAATIADAPWGAMYGWDDWNFGRTFVLMTRTVVGGHSKYDAIEAACSVWTFSAY